MVIIVFVDEFMPGKKRQKAKVGEKNTVTSSYS